MIAILSQTQSMVHDLEEYFKSSKIPFRVLSPAHDDSLLVIFDSEIHALIVDPVVEQFPMILWKESLKNLHKKIPIILIEQENHDQDQFIGFENFIRSKSELSSILAALKTHGIFQLSHRKKHSKAISPWQNQMIYQMLQRQGALSLITIDASSYRTLGIEYGSDVYQRIQEILRMLIVEQWGHPGCLRTSDLVCQKIEQANLFYVILSPPRSGQKVPAPGALEIIADRLAFHLRNGMYREMFAPKDKRILPDCIHRLPEIKIGFGSVMQNPCMESHELIELLLERTNEMGEVQIVRYKNNQRELMQGLIQSTDLLFPNFQGIFSAQKLTKQVITESQKQNSLAPLKPFIFGFESLIRLRGDGITTALGKSITEHFDTKYLRPDVLFSMAKSSKVALELDQTCMIKAIQYGIQLPGKLMINVLPRNLYHIERFKNLLTQRQNIIFEVSESEAVNNFDLMLKVKEQLSKKNVGIAADDFGNGYGSFERIMNIRPEIIKFDRSLIDHIDQDIRRQQFVKGLIDASKSSGMIVLAEGIERWEEIELLQKMGIELVQGFLFHRPSTLEKIMADLKESEEEENSVIAA